jgi:malonyl-CoA O-methyltransferase
MNQAAQYGVNSKAEHENLPLYFYPATTPSKLDPIVLLHGWGSDRSCWNPLLESLRGITGVYLLDVVDGSQLIPGEKNLFLDELLSRLPPKFTLMGWSLGGMLATVLTAHFPDRISHLITLATNVKFVAQDNWAQAMPAKIFSTFVDSFAANPEVTLKRFAGLMAKGDRQERPLLKQLKNLTAKSWATNNDEQPERILWQKNLQLLGFLDNQSLFSELRVKGLHLFGAGDNLVPNSAAETIKRLNATQKIAVLPEVGHAFFFSEPMATMGYVRDFLQSEFHSEAALAGELNKSRIAKSFGHSAYQYDSVAGLQRRVADSLLAKINTEQQSSCLDLGCGTGYAIPKLNHKFSQVLGVDLAEGMLNFCQSHHSAKWVCGDAENIPLADACMDVVFSSLAIQWCENLPALFSSLMRVVKPGGRVFIATLGPQTLHELRGAWQQVDDYVHVNNFVPLCDLKSAAKSAGFSRIECDQENIVLGYQQLRELTYELKTLGAHNMNAGQRAGLTSLAKAKMFKKAYEDYRDSDGMLPATYEVFYFELVR